jgi:lipopolysaccharide transport system ATP-binding protein
MASVKAGQRFEVEFRFRSMFLPGTYFTNAGCNGCSVDGESGFLHRIVDAAMFKIEAKETDRGKAGFYDLSAEPSCRISGYRA